MIGRLGTPPCIIIGVPPVSPAVLGSHTPVQAYVDSLAQLQCGAGLARLPACLPARARAYDIVPV